MTFWQLTVNAQDPERLARFWASALGYTSTPPEQPDTTWWEHYRGRLEDGEAFTDRIFDPAGLRPPIWFQRTDTEKAGSNRLHLDLYPTGRDNALSVTERIEIVEGRVAELVALGAHVQRRMRYDHPDDPVYFVTLHDPEGNEFCVS